MDEETRRMALQTYEKYNADGMRMIAVAQKNEVPHAVSVRIIPARQQPPRLSAADFISLVFDIWNRFARQSNSRRRYAATCVVRLNITCLRHSPIYFLSV